MMPDDRDEKIDHDRWDFLIPFFKPRIFTIEEANLALPDVIRITEETLSQLNSAAGRFEGLGLRKWSAVTGVIEEDSIRAGWVRRIARMGVLPKGFFTVDFASTEEGTFYCWTYGEDNVGHQHKAWEGFDDRVPVTSETSFH